MCVCVQPGGGLSQDTCFRLQLRLLYRRIVVLQVSLRHISSLFTVPWQSCPLLTSVLGMQTQLHEKEESHQVRLILSILFISRLL